MTPPSAHGIFEHPAKSAYSFERFDSDWEMQYMKQLEADPEVEAWTKNHKIRIPYIDSNSRKREYRPDFLVRLTTGDIQLQEVKGGHLIDSAKTKKKLDAGRRWCEERGAKFVVVTKE